MSSLQYMPGNPLEFELIFERRTLPAWHALLKWPQNHGQNAQRTGIGVGGLEDLDWRECQQCLAGQGECCAKLFKRHEPDIARQMWRFSRNPAVCEELVQEVFVEAYLSLARYRPQQVPFVHWLRRIATRVGYRYWKQQARQRRHVALEGFDKPVNEELPNDPSTAAALLHSLLARLSAADRLILTLMYFEGCKIEEIAQRTGWNRVGLKMRAHRARNRLKEIIEREKLLDKLEEIIHGPA